LKRCSPEVRRETGRSESNAVIRRLRIQSANREMAVNTGSFVLETARRKRRCGGVGGARWIRTLGMVRPAVVIELVSADSLRKTGIFPNWAGDFSAFGRLRRQIWSVETTGEQGKPRCLRPFRALMGNGVREQDWLAGDAVLIAPVSSRIPC
jgi:hypothetical protein